MTVTKYRIACATCGYVYDYVEGEDPIAPTECPNDSEHTVNDVAVADVAGPKDVRITEQSVDIDVHDIAFPDRTGYNIYLPGYVYTTVVN